MLGDFNEWTTRAGDAAPAVAHGKRRCSRHLRRSRTYPGLLPFLHLDHIYYDPVLRLEKLDAAPDAEGAGGVGPFAAGRGICESAGHTKRKWFQVTRFPALLTTGMHGTEHCNRKSPGASPVRSPIAVFASLRINASRRAATFSRSGPVARNGLSLACNGSRFSGPPFQGQRSWPATSLPS